LLRIDIKDSANHHRFVLIDLHMWRHTVTTWNAHITERGSPSNNLTTPSSVELAAPIPFDNLRPLKLSYGAYQETGRLSNLGCSRPYSHRKGCMVSSRCNQHLFVMRRRAQGTLVKVIQMPPSRSGSTAPVQDQRLPAFGYRCLECRRPGTVVHGNEQDRRRMIGTLLCSRCGGTRIARNE
jgi:hypothetical protein